MIDYNKGVIADKLKEDGLFVTFVLDKQASQILPKTQKPNDITKKHVRFGAIAMSDAEVTSLYKQCLNKC